MGVSSAEFAAAAAALRRGAARGSGAVQLGPLRLHVQACLGQGAVASVFQARSMARPSCLCRADGAALTAHRERAWGRALLLALFQALSLAYKGGAFESRMKVRMISYIC